MNRLRLKDSSFSRQLLSRRSPVTPVRQQSTAPKPESQSKYQRRLDKLLSKLPSSPSLQRLRSQPLSHVISFLILHELTAIVPLFGLTAALHYAPEGYGVEAWENIPYIEEGKRRMWRWGVRRGWVSGDDETRDKQLHEDGLKREGWGCVVMELAVAYAVTKAFLPVRLGVSAWATPWFARRVFVPFSNMFKRKATTTP